MLISLWQWGRKHLLFPDVRNIKYRHTQVKIWKIHSSTSFSLLSAADHSMGDPEVSTHKCCWNRWINIYSACAIQEKIIIIMQVFINCRWKKKKPLADTVGIRWDIKIPQLTGYWTYKEPPNCSSRGREFSRVLHRLHYHWVDQNDYRSMSKNWV